MAGWVLACQDTGPGRGADRARVGVRKPHAPFGEAFDVGRLVEGGLAVQGGVRPTQVVGQNEDQVLGGLGPRNDD